jgi:hypothetical protein
MRSIKSVKARGKPPHPGKKIRRRSAAFQFDSS